MSRDYSKSEVVSIYVPACSQEAIGNGTKIMGVIGSNSVNWGALALSVTVIQGAVNADNVIKLQASDTAGSFASPTELASIAVAAAATDAAGTVKHALVDASKFDLDVGQVLRVVNVATGTDANLKYRADVVVTPYHC